MIRAFMEFLHDIGRKDRVEVQQHLDYPYAVGYGVAVPLSWPPVEPFVHPTPFQVYTLAGVARFLAANIDAFKLETLVARCRAAGVHVWGPLEGEAKERPGYVQAIYDGEHFVGWLGLRHFRLAVVKCFEDTSERKRLLEDTAAFSFKSAIVKEEGQDGLGISTTDKRDKIASTQIIVKNPVYNLSPWRSFPEAGPQIPSPHLCQIRGGEDEETQASLTDCGGSAWEAEAAAQVGEKLLALCKELDVTVSVVW